MRDVPMVASRRYYSLLTGYSDSYPEVTGYIIPTLYDFGRDTAKWLRELPPNAPLNGCFLCRCRLAPFLADFTVPAALSAMVPSPPCSIPARFCKD